MEGAASEDAIEMEVELPESLLRRAEEMGLSRNEFFTLALEGFIERMTDASKRDEG